MTWWRSPCLAMAVGALSLMACSEQTPEDAATANIGSEPRGASDAAATPPGELPPSLPPAGSEAAPAAREESTAPPPVATEGVPPNAELAPPEIVPEEALDPPSAG